MLELDLVIATYKTKMQSSNEGKQKPNKKENESYIQNTSTPIDVVLHIKVATKSKINRNICLFLNNANVNVLFLY
jgi:hypothetical protein